MEITTNIINDIQSIINGSRAAAVRAVDRERVVMYWNIGKEYLKKNKGASSGRRMAIT